MKRKLYVTNYWLLIALLFCFQSCKDNWWDEPAGGQEIPLPKVDVAFAFVKDPTMGKDNNKYHIISSNMAIDGITYTKGLVQRTTSDLVNIDELNDANAYVLTDVLDNWASARMARLDPNVVVANIKIGQPCLVKVENEWRLYYSVSAGSKASTIGYATASSLDGPWTDKGEILYSARNATYCAYAPSVCASPDGSKLYMVFGNSVEGIYGVELNKSDSKPVGSPVQLINRTEAVSCTNPELFYYNGYYHIIFTHFLNDLYLNCHVLSASPLANYKDFSGRAGLNINAFWNITRVMTNYALFGDGQPVWSAVSGVSVYQENGKFFCLNDATIEGTSIPQLQIHEMHWIEDARRNSARNFPVPAIAPERFGGEVSGEVVEADIPGIWHYGTLWGHVVSGINDPMVFKADKTYDGGIWDYNPTSHILMLTSAEWGGEKIFIYLSKNKLLGNVGATKIVGSGHNDTFGDFPGAWMIKEN